MMRFGGLFAWVAVAVVGSNAGSNPGSGCRAEALDRLPVLVGQASRRLAVGLIEATCSKSGPDGSTVQVGNPSPLGIQRGNALVCRMVRVAPIDRASLVRVSTLHPGDWLCECLGEPAQVAAARSASG
jgi:hypothetical protein